MYAYYYLFLLALFAVIIFISITLLRNYRRLSSFGGPFVASLTDLWRFKASLDHRVHYAQQEALEKYGSVARIGPNMLVTNDPKLLRHMSAPRSSWTRGSWYEVFNFDGTTESVFSTRDEKRHAKLRAKLGPAYSGKGVDNLESSIADQITKMLNLLRDRYISLHRPVDMTRLSQYFTLDVLSQIAFGNAFGYLEADNDLYDYIKIGQSFLPILELLSNHAWLRPILFSAPVQALLAPKDAEKVGQGCIMAIAYQAVAERFKSADPVEKQKADMLGSFVSHGLTQREAESESHIQILAGSDSTSTTFRMGMLYIVTNPRVYVALRKEIDAALLDGGISTSAIITDSEARRLSYLQAVIWETLRVCPPLFGLQPKVAPPQGETVNGMFFPGGTEVVICPAALTHRKDIFGEDADVFRPERWLEADDCLKREYTETVELIFGSGRFGCLGKNIAFLELNKVFVELLRHFDWAIVDATRPIRENIGAGVWLQNGMMMTVTERKG